MYCYFSFVQIALSFKLLFVHNYFPYAIVMLGTLAKHVLGLLYTTVEKCTGRSRISILDMARDGMP